MTFYDTNKMFDNEQPMSLLNYQFTEIVYRVVHEVIDYYQAVHLGNNMFRLEKLTKW